MKASELIGKLMNILEKDGNLNIYTGDMEAPRLEINRTVDRGDIELYGEMYLTIEGR